MSNILPYLPCLQQAGATGAYSSISLSITKINNTFGAIYFGDLIGNRTRIYAVKGHCPNR